MELKKQYKKQHYIRNQEKLKELAKQRYMIDSERVKNRVSIYYHRSPQKHRDREQGKYRSNPQKQRDRKQKEYIKDPKKQRDRKKEEYSRDPEEQRDRKKEDYSRDPQKHRDRKMEEYIEAKQLQSSMDMLNNFQEAGKYGPIFPCVSCHQFNWRMAVQKVHDINTLEQGIVDVDYVVQKNVKLFSKIDCFWVCKTCKLSIERGIRPKFSSLNSLQCPWEGVPTEMLELNNVRFILPRIILIMEFFMQVEMSMIAPVTLFANFCVRDNAAIRQSGKLVAIPISVDSRQRMRTSFADTLKELPQITLVRGNSFNRPVYQGIVCKKMVKDAINYLSAVNPNLINTINFENCEVQPVENVSQMEPQTVLLPDGMFAPGEKSYPVNFLHMEKPYSKILPLFFRFEQDDFNGILAGLQITEAQWVKHMLRNVGKKVSENHTFMFAASYRLDMKKLEVASRSPINCHEKGSCDMWETKDERFKTEYFNLTGSTDYYQKQLYDIFAKSEILGYPDVFFTFTSTNDWDVNLSTALSQNGYNIWHSTDERKLLTTRTQDLLQEPTDQYYAHIRSSSTDNDKEYKCPFHENCQRKPIQAVLTEEEKKALLRKNFYNEQRIFEQRTRSLINNILCNENSNQRVTGIHTIKEFGNIPGLTHAHGVGWMAGREIRVIFSKLHTGEFILPSEVTKTTALVDTMITTEISSQGLVEQFPDIDTTRAEKIINLAKKVQTHSCSYKCSTGNTSDGCLHHFPRLPSVKTILCSTLDPGTDEKEAEELSSGAKEVKIAVRKTLEGLRRNDLLEYSDLSDVLVHALGEIDEARASKENKIQLKPVRFPNCKEVKDWFKYFVTNNVQHALLFAVYHTALSVATWKVDGNVVAQVI